MSKRVHKNQEATLGGVRTRDYKDLDLCNISGVAGLMRNNLVSFYTCHVYTPMSDSLCVSNLLRGGQEGFSRISWIKTSEVSLRGSRGDSVFLYQAARTRIHASMNECALTTALGDKHCPVTRAKEQDLSHHGQGGSNINNNQKRIAPL